MREVVITIVLAIVFVIGVCMILISKHSKPEEPCMNGYVEAQGYSFHQRVCVPGYVP